MILRWRQRKHTPNPVFAQAGISPSSLSQTLDFYLHSVDFEAEYFWTATVQLRITSEPNRALLFYSSGASLIKEKAQENGQHVMNAVQFPTSNIHFKARIFQPPCTATHYLPNLPTLVDWNNTRNVD